MINKDNIEALIEFGGLLVHEIVWFDTLCWKEKVELRTFNEEYAIKKFTSMQKAGYVVKMRNYFVHFNQEK